MDFLNTLNEQSLLEYLPQKHVKDLVIDQPYPITQLKLITKGPHGTSLVAELDDFQVFLPQRLVKNINAEDLVKFRDKKYSLVNRGELIINKGKFSTTYKLEFVKN